MEVESLQRIAMAAVRYNFTNVAEILLNDESTSLTEIAEQFKILHLQVLDFLPCDHSQLVKNYLEAAYILSRAECCPKREFSIKHLISIVASLKPKEVDFPTYYGGFKNLKCVYSAFFDNFQEMKELKKLAFSCPKDDSVEQNFIRSCPVLKNLVSFSTRNTSNKVVKAICENCPLIEEINLGRSDEVTDESIENLVKCKKLQKIIGNSAVSSEGYAQLLLNTRSDCLLEIGWVDNLEKFLHRLEQDAEPGRVFQLQTLASHGKNTDLQLVPVFFPNIVELTLSCFDPEELTPNIAPLDWLKNVREASIVLHLKSADFFTNANSHVLTNLHLRYHSDTDTRLRIKITEVMRLGLQCPNVEYLRLSSFSFMEDTGSTDYYELFGRSFQKLRLLHLCKCSQASSFKVILSHTFSIQRIDVHDEESLDCSVTDDFLEYILNTNPLEKLLALQLGPGSKISAHIIKQILSNCREISCLGYFSELVGLSDEQVQEIRDWIAKNGLMVDMLFDFEVCG